MKVVAMVIRGYSLAIILKAFDGQPSIDQFMHFAAVWKSKVSLKLRVF